MELTRYIKNKDWPPLLGYGLFIGMMATGYYYNLTFVQFGLLDLGTRLVGMTRQQVSMNMAYLALITSVTAIVFGLWMMRRGWSRDFRFKLRCAFAVVLAQTILTALAPVIRSEAAFLAWIVAASLALGVGVPATFSMTVDLVPRRDRGMTAALVTAGAYFPAAVFSSTWTIEQFSAQILGVMVAGSLGLGVLAFARLPWIDRLAEQHTRPEFARGRFVRYDEHGAAHISGRVIALILLMFGIYFIDSLGFLRLADTPALFEAAWGSPNINNRLVIGVVHVIAALVGGILYAALDEKQLFLWIFGIFALVHFMYTFMLRAQLGSPETLSEPMLYALAVSLYTVVNFAIWADISVPRTISRNAAIGVALSGWAATFLSTALALQLQLRGVSLDLHLRLVDSLAILFFLVVLALIYFPGGGGSRRKSSSQEVKG